MVLARRPNRFGQGSVCLCQESRDQIGEVERDGLRFPWDEDEETKSITKELGSLGFHCKKFAKVTSVKTCFSRADSEKTFPPSFEDAQILGIYCRIRTATEGDSAVKPQNRKGRPCRPVGQLPFTEIRVIMA
jgi:hypothetical protein